VDICFIKIGSGSYGGGRSESDDFGGGRTITSYYQYLIIIL